MLQLRQEARQEELIDLLCRLWGCQLNLPPYVPLIYGANPFCVAVEGLQLGMPLLRFYYFPHPLFCRENWFSPRDITSTRALSEQLLLSAWKGFTLYRMTLETARESLCQGKWSFHFCFFFCFCQVSLSLSPSMLGRTLFAFCGITF